MKIRRLFLGICFVGACAPTNDKTTAQVNTEPVVKQTSEKSDANNRTNNKEDLYCKNMLQTDESDKWAIILIDEFGAPNNCSSDADTYFSEAGQIIGNVYMTWDDFTYTFKGRLPETTIRKVSIINFSDSKLTKSWLDTQIHNLIDPDLEIDLSNDLNSSALSEEYGSEISGFNASFRITFGENRELRSFGFSMAL